MAIAWRHVDIERQHDGWWVIAWNYRLNDNGHSNRAGLHYGPYPNRIEAHQQAQDIRNSDIPATVEEA